jgi:hypothetical protein
VLLTNLDFKTPVFYLIDLRPEFGPIQNLLAFLSKLVTKMVVKRQLYPISKYLKRIEKPKPPKKSGLFKK